jgi:hypothetical protein
MISKAESIEQIRERTSKMSDGRTPQVWSFRPGIIRSEEKLRPPESGLPISIGRGQSGMA